MNRRLFVLLLMAVPVLAKEPPPKASMVLTMKENGLENQTEFVCHGKIHGYIRLPRREAGVHQLSSRWVTPLNKVASESSTQVDFRPARSTAYVWFAFPEKNSLAGSPDPTVDQAEAGYNGPWHVEIAWDDKPLLTSTFKVSCP